jgi:hypothetical protein
MSWLSNLFGGGGEDPRAVEQRQAAAAEAARRESEAAAARQQQGQIDYLNSLRADQEAERQRQAALDPTATRQAAMNTINASFAPGFESLYLPTNVTDPYETEAYTAQRGGAEEKLNNLLKRKVITDTGYQAGIKNLDEQAPRVRTQLQDLADTLLNAERDKLSGIAGSARQRASSLGVGEAFDFNPYAKQAQDEFGAFSSGLADRFKGSIPGDLFDTSSLGAIAGGAGGGAGSGVGYNPDLLAGIGEPKTDDTDPFSGQKLTQKRTSTVF